MSICIYHFQNIIGCCPPCNLKVCVSCLSQHLDHLPTLITFKNLLPKLQPIYKQIESHRRIVESNIQETKRMFTATKTNIVNLIQELQDRHKKGNNSNGKVLQQIHSLKNNQLDSIKIEDIQHLNQIIADRKRQQNIKDQNLAESQIVNTILKKYRLELKRIEAFIRFNYLNQKQYNKANQYAANGNQNEALKIYNRQLQNIIKNNTIKDVISHSIQKHIDLSKKINNQNNTIWLFESLSLIDPTNPNYYQQLGNIYKSKGMNIQALFYFNQAAKVQAATPSILQSQGICYQDLGMEQKALISYQKAARLEPQEPQHYYSQGLIYRNKGDISKAEAYFNKARQIQSIQDNKTKIHFEGSQKNQLLALQSYQFQNQVTPFQYTFDKIDQSTRSREQNINYQPYSNDFDKTLLPNNNAYFYRNNTEYPNNQTATFQTIIKQSSINETISQPISISEIDQYLSRDFNNPQLWFKKGLILQKHNRSSDALKCYQKASTLSPNDRKYNQAKRGLELLIRKKHNRCF